MNRKMDDIELFIKKLIKSDFLYYAKLDAAQQMYLDHPGHATEMIKRIKILDIPFLEFIGWNDICAWCEVYRGSFECMGFECWNLSTSKVEWRQV